MLVVLTVLVSLSSFSGSVYAKTVKQGKALQIRSVRFEAMTKEDFLRISEFFSGKENKGMHLVLRTDPDERGGVYCVIALNKVIKRLPAGTKLTLDYILPEDSKVRTKEFILPAGEGRSREIYLGLTGASRPMNDTLPIAWKLTFADNDGKLLMEKKSYLWEMPNDSVGASSVNK